MSVVLLIHQLDKDGNRVKTFNYNKDERVKLEDAVALEQLVGAKPQVYVTGMGALTTQKRLVRVLDRLAKSFPDTIFMVERAPVEGGGLTANSRIGHGAVPPQRIRGG